MVTKLEELKQKSTIGDTITTTTKDEVQKIPKQAGKVIDEVSVFAQYPPDDAYKFFIQKIRQSDGNIIFRFCYYTLDRTRTRIVFGQYASILDEKEFKELMTKAKEKGFF